ncbi:MAG: GGDEF domain-containing protein, partial [Chitinophagaceae bacterium]
MPFVIPSDEQDRLKALRRLEILDTPTEAAFDRLTSLASRLFDVPVSLVSLVDSNRQWFKAKIGL